METVARNHIYFASDFHLGIPDRTSSLARERRLVQWLEMAAKDAAGIYLMGDLFDFWFEYRTAIPKGYVRLLGALAALTDSGIKVHLFRGNHDMWAFDYLEDEIGIELHREPEFHSFSGKKFYLAHGDGLGPGDHGYKFIKKVFANRINQQLFRWIHPDLGIGMAFFWSRKSRAAALEKEKMSEDRNIRLIGERITVHSNHILRQNPDLNFLVYGHYHYPMVTGLKEGTTQIVLGDWLTHFTYAVFDGDELQLKKFGS